MPAKKRRPVRKSYAGVAPSVSSALPKKRPRQSYAGAAPSVTRRTRPAPTVTLRKKALDALTPAAEGDVESYVQRAEGWRARMEAAEAALASGQETMREQAGVVASLSEQLRELQVAYLAEEREVDFWVDQADHYRNELVKLHRALAAERPWSWPR